jgi:predicted protein tyrosine phosphatase
MKRILFVCTKNQWRSPTAEHVFADWPGISTASAGLDPSSANPVSGEQIEWADLIVVMESAHRNKLADRFQTFLKDKRVVVLGIPDQYRYMDPRLVALLERKVTPYLR